MRREGARPEIVRDKMGRANIDVTPNVYGKGWWEERVDAVTQAVEAVTDAAQNAEKEEKENQPECVSNRMGASPLGLRQEARITSCW